MTEGLWLDSTSAIEVRELMSYLDEYVNDAIITGAVFELDDTALVDDISIAKVEGIDGYYIGFVPAETALEDGVEYIVRVTIVTTEATLVVYSSVVAGYYRI